MCLLLNMYAIKGSGLPPKTMVAGVAHAFGVLFSVGVGAILNGTRRLSFSFIFFWELCSLLFSWSLIGLKLNQCALIFASSVLIANVDHGLGPSVCLSGSAQVMLYQKITAQNGCLWHVEQGGLSDSLVNLSE